MKKAPNSTVKRQNYKLTLSPPKDSKEAEWRIFFLISITIMWMQIIFTAPASTEQFDWMITLLGAIVANVISDAIGNRRGGP